MKSAVFFDNQNLLHGAELEDGTRLKSTVIYHIKGAKEH
jgi:hypothetical protein